MTLDQQAVASFRAALAGTLLLPGEEGYDEARHLWNGMIDRHPAAIAQCAGPEDVALAISFARQQALPLTIKGGGHGVAGKAVCDGGLMIDCSPMKSILIDPVSRTATAGGGVTWGEFDTATQAHGLATTGGVVASTGIAGLTLGGGIGFLIRRHGLSCDNLIAAEVVTANGELVTASDTEHPDLLWALRGGGGNFGVVTSLTYQLHEVSEVVGGIVTHPFADAYDAIRHYHEVTRAASDDLKIDLGIGTASGGERVVNFVLCSCGGDSDEGAIEDLREFGAPVADTVATTTYLGMQMLFAETFPHGTLNYWKSGFLPELNDKIIELMIARYAVAPTPHLALNLEHLGGAMWRVDPTATAFSERSAAYNLIITGCWTDPAETEQNIGWIRETWAALQPFSKQSVYVNYIDEGDEARTDSAFGGNLARLAEVKSAYDPENVFRHNHNIAPKSV